MAAGAKDGTATPGLPSESERPAREVVVIAVGNTTTINGSGASADGSTIRITAGGTYSISGTLKDGQIIVDSRDEKAVRLLLNGLDITSASSAPIYVIRAKATIIALADGTENHITDAASYNIEGSEADEPVAAIFSKSNLTFAGNGSLTVEANYRNAITSKDELNITGGNITVNSVSDGIRGRDSIVITDGNITVNAGADGLRSNNDEASTKGFVAIEGGTIRITAGEDGIQAETTALIRGGMITVISGGGSANSSRGNSLENRGPHRGFRDSGPSISAKGIKAVSDIKIEGGTINVDSSDDAIHSNNSVTIDDGNIVLASGDDGIHSDSTLTINGGDISITRSFEAIDSAVITINGGNIRLVASDDGINVSGGNDRAPVNGRPGPDNFDTSVDKHLKIEGGYVVIDATGDGLDINGWVKMTGGTVIVNGPIVNFNGALDYDREFTMAGGILVAVGSSGMVQSPDATSTQYSLALNLASPQSAGTLVHIEAEDGTGILTFAPMREYQSVVYSSSELKKGSTYTVYIGGSSTGSVVDGVYAGGTYTPGIRSGGFTISSAVTGGRNRKAHEN
ncbi:MAG: carbohydrate-binding domain-containing protein [Chloroflexi bacterium]|nr:carbohydrate-binding domain-containing protein [Chloroflexota bacterium]